MRWIFAIFSILLFSGCIYKTNVIALKPYKLKSISIADEQSIQKAYIKSIIDARAHKRVIGKIRLQKNTYPLYTKNSVKLWLYEALDRGLHANGRILLDKPLREAISIEAAILNLRIIYDETTKNNNNLRAYADIQLSLKRGWKQELKNIYHKKNSWFESAPSQSELEHFTQTFLEEIANDIIQRSLSL